MMRDVGLGVAGAVLAGLIFGGFTTPVVNGIRVFGLVVTIAGAIGKERAWFRCPTSGCPRRVAKLYLGDRVFACGVRWRQQSAERQR